MINKLIEIYKRKMENENTPTWMRVCANDILGELEDIKKDSLENQFDKLKEVIQDWKEKGLIPQSRNIELKVIYDEVDKKWSVEWLDGLESSQSLNGAVKKQIKTLVEEMEVQDGIE